MAVAYRLHGAASLHAHVVSREKPLAKAEDDYLPPLIVRLANCVCTLLPRQPPRGPHWKRGGKLVKAFS